MVGMKIASTGKFTYVVPQGEIVRNVKSNGVKAGLSVSTKAGPKSTVTGPSQTLSVQPGKIHTL